MCVRSPGRAAVPQDGQCELEALDQDVAESASSASDSSFLVHPESLAQDAGQVAEIGHQEVQIDEKFTSEAKFRRSGNLDTSRCGDCDSSTNGSRLGCQVGRRGCQVKSQGAPRGIGANHCGVRGVAAERDEWR